MSTASMRFIVSVGITHELGDAGPRRFAGPFRTFLDQDSNTRSQGQ